MLEFSRYFVASGAGALVDWGFFHACAVLLGYPYPVALAISFTLGTLTHYNLNKIFTFRCRGRSSGLRVTVYLTIVSGSFVLSLLLMAVMIDGLGLHETLSRILTSFITLFLNYLLHKHVTFKEFVGRHN